ncbi:MAG: DUF4404 family protein [Deltaproteobacteria bacterium]|nr:DUF4404 family protein [Deltaproteobacteria bacterium]
MADEFTEIDSEGVYSGMSLEDFGVRVSGRAGGRETHRGTERGVVIVPKDQLREFIHHLRDELAGGEPLSSEDRARLEGVLGEVSELLESEAGESSTGSEHFDELREFAERFEESHPKVALVLGRIADALSQLGI